MTTDLAFRLSVAGLALLNIGYAVELLALTRTRHFQLLLGPRRTANRDPARLQNAKRQTTLGSGVIVLCGAFILVLPTDRLFGPALGLVIGTGLVLRATEFGYEGSDHVREYMNWFLLLACSLFIVNYDYWQNIYLALGAALGVSFYFGAAVVKIVSTDWRSGSAIVTALSTESFGHQVAKRVLESSLFLRVLSSWVVILWELLLPFVVFWGRHDLLVLWMLFGGLFHTAITVLMRLPLFLLCIASLYPCLAWVTLTLLSHI